MDSEITAIKATLTANGLSSSTNLANAISTNGGLVSTNAADISANAATHASGISTNAASASDNAAAATANSGLISTNSADISSNAATHASGISINAADIDALNATVAPTEAPVTTTTTFTATLSSVITSHSPRSCSAEFQTADGTWIQGTPGTVSGSFNPTSCVSNNCADSGWILGGGDSATWSVTHAGPIVAARVFNVYGGGARAANWAWSGSGSYGSLGTWAYSATSCGWHDYQFPGTEDASGLVTFTASVASITSSHSPRSCEAEFQTSAGNWIAGTAVGVGGSFDPTSCQSNNCGDSGWILGGSDTAQWTVPNTNPIVAARIYNVYGGSARGANWAWSGSGSYGSLGTMDYSASSCGWHDYTFA
jgi:hypothetical protein